MRVAALLAMVLLALGVAACGGGPTQSELDQALAETVSLRVELEAQRQEVEALREELAALAVRLDELSDALVATTENPNDPRRLVGSAPFAAFWRAPKVQDQPVQDLELSLELPKTPFCYHNIP